MVTLQPTQRRNARRIQREPGRAPEVTWFPAGGSARAPDMSDTCLSAPGRAPRGSVDVQMSLRINLGKALPRKPRFNAISYETRREKTETCRGNPRRAENTRDAFGLRFGAIRVHTARVTVVPGLFSSEHVKFHRNAKDDALTLNLRPKVRAGFTVHGQGLRSEGTRAGRDALCCCVSQVPVPLGTPVFCSCSKLDS